MVATPSQSPDELRNTTYCVLAYRVTHVVKVNVRTCGCVVVVVTLEVYKAGPTALVPPQAYK